MKRIGLFLLAVVMVAGLAGCKTQSVALKGTSSTPKDDAYNCALSQLATMDYEISGDRGIGVVRGFKNITITQKDSMRGSQKNSVDIRIQVTVVDIQAGATSMVRGSGKGYYSGGSSEKLEKIVHDDLTTILSNCRVENITTIAAP